MTLNLVQPKGPIGQVQGASGLQKSCSNVKVNPHVVSKQEAPLMLEIDIWSCGVILLSFLTKRFPFFNSADDVDAMIELSAIFGKEGMKQCARLHSTPVNYVPS